MLPNDISVKFSLKPFARVERQLDHLTTQMESVMAKLSDIAARVEALSADVTAQKTVIEGTKTLLTGLVAMINSLKEQLAEAIAAGGSTVELQAVADKLTELETAVEGATKDLADAVTANTPVA